MSVQLALRNIRKSFSNKHGTVDVLGEHHWSVRLWKNYCL